MVPRAKNSEKKSSGRLAPTKIVKTAGGCRREMQTLPWGRGGGTGLEKGCWLGAPPGGGAVGP